MMSHHRGITLPGFMLLIIVLQTHATEAQLEGECARDENVLREDADGKCTYIGLEIFKAVGSDGCVNFCCKCSPGNYLAELCPLAHKGIPYPRCSPCPFEENNPDQQFWMDKQNNRTSCFRTLPQSACDVLMNTIWQMGSLTTNARCICKDGYHSASHNEDVSGGCHLHSPCDKGFQPSTLANATTDTQCGICSNGTFSNKSSAVDFCLPWTQCKPNQEIIFEGNRTHDRVCSVIVEIENETDPGNVRINGSDPTPKDTETSALSGGGIAGIVIAAIFIVGGLVAALWCCCCKERRSSLSVTRLPRKWCKSHHDRKGPEADTMLNPVNLEDAKGDDPSQSDKMSNGGTGDHMSRQASQRVAMPLPTHAEQSDGNGVSGETSGNGLSNDGGHGDQQEADTMLARQDGNGDNMHTSRNASIDAGRPGGASASDRDSQNVEKEQKQGKEDSSSPSDDDKAFDENSQISKDEPAMKYIDETREGSASDHISEGPSARNQANPPGVIMAPAPNPAHPQQDIPPPQPNNVPPQPNNPAAQLLDKARFLELLPTWVEEIDAAEENGCRDCCFVKRLKDSEIGKAMLLQLVELITDVILPFIRLYLSETEIDDIKNNNVGKESEIRYKLLLKIQSKEGRALTPASLLAKAASIRVNEIRDEMIKEFFNGFAPCH